MSNNFAAGCKKGYDEVLWDEAACVLTMTGINVPTKVLDFSKIIDKVEHPEDIVTRIEYTADGAAYYVNEVGEEFPIPTETLTTIVTDDTGAQFYVNENGAYFPLTVAPDDILTAVSIDAATCALEYRDELGDTHSYPLPRTDVLYDAVNHCLALTACDGQQTLIKLRPETPVLKVDGCDITLTAYGVTQTQSMPNAVVSVSSVGQPDGEVQVTHCDGTTAQVVVTSAAPDVFELVSPGVYKHTSTDGQSLQFDICDVMRQNCPGVLAISSSAGGAILNISYDDGRTQTIDLARENFLSSAVYNAQTKQITFTLTDGTVLPPIDLSDLVDDVETLDLGTGSFSVNGTVIDVCKLAQDGGCVGDKVLVTSTGVTVSSRDGTVQTLDVCAVMTSKCPGVTSVSIDPATGTFIVRYDDGSEETKTLALEDVRLQSLVLDNANQIIATLSNGVSLPPLDLSQFIDTVTTTDAGDGTFSVNGTAIDVCKLVKDGGCLGSVVSVVGPSIVIDDQAGGTATHDICAVMATHCPGVRDVAWDAATTTFTYHYDNGTTKDVTLTFPSATVDVRLVQVTHDTDDNSLSFHLSDGGVLGPIDLQDFVASIDVTDHGDGTATVDGVLLDICKMVSDGGCAGDTVTVTTTGAVVTKPDMSTEELNVCNVMKAHCPGVRDVTWDAATTTFTYYYDNSTTKDVVLAFPSQTVDVKLDEVLYDETSNTMSFRLTDGSTLGPITLKSFLLNVVDHDDGTASINGQTLDICKMVSDGGCAGDTVTVTSTGVTVDKGDGSSPQVLDVCAVMTANCPGLRDFAYDATNRTFTFIFDDETQRTATVSVPPPVVTGADLYLGSVELSAATNVMEFKLNDGTLVDNVDLSALLGVSTASAVYDTSACTYSVTVDGVTTTAPLASSVALSGNCLVELTDSCGNTSSANVKHTLARAGDNLTLTSPCGTDAGSVPIDRCALGIPKHGHDTLPNATLTAPGAQDVGTITAAGACPGDVLYITVSGQLRAEA